MVVWQWCREQLFATCAKFTLEHVVVSFELPVAHGADLLATIYFVTCKETARVGKVVFRSSVAILVSRLRSFNWLQMYDQDSLSHQMLIIDLSGHCQCSCKSDPAGSFRPCRAAGTA